MRPMLKGARAGKRITCSFSGKKGRRENKGKSRGGGEKSEKKSKEKSDLAFPFLLVGELKKNVPPSPPRGQPVSPPLRHGRARGCHGAAAGGSGRGRHSSCGGEQRPRRRKQQAWLPPGRRPTTTTVPKPATLFFWIDFERGGRVSFDEASVDCGTTRRTLSSPRREGSSRGPERDARGGGRRLCRSPRRRFPPQSSTLLHSGCSLSFRFLSLRSRRAASAILVWGEIAPPLFFSHSPRCDSGPRC